MFGPRATVIHVGAYAMVLLAMASGVLSLWSINPRLALVLTLMQIGFNMLLYGALMRVTDPGAPLPEGRLRPVTATAAFCALVLIIFLFRSLGRRETSDRSETFAALSGDVPVLENVPL